MDKKRYFEYKDGKSSKFWEIQISKNKVTTRYGRIGSEGQQTVKDNKSMLDAEKIFDKLIAEKTGKGYSEIKEKQVLAKEKTIVSVKNKTKEMSLTELEKEFNIEFPESYKHIFQKLVNYKKNDFEKSVKELRKLYGQIPPLLFMHDYFIPFNKHNFFSHLKKFNALNLDPALCLIPIGSIGGIDYYCFGFGKKIKNDVPIVYVSLDTMEARVVANNFEDFLFENFINSIASYIEKDKGNDYLERFLNGFSLLKEYFSQDRNKVIKGILDSVPGKIKNNIDLELVDFLSDKECEKIIQKNIKKKFEPKERFKFIKKLNNFKKPISFKKDNLEKIESSLKFEFPESYKKLYNDGMLSKSTFDSCTLEQAREMYGDKIPLLYFVFDFLPIQPKNIKEEKDLFQSLFIENPKKQKIFPFIQTEQGDYFCFYDDRKSKNKFIVYQSLDDDNSVFWAKNIEDFIFRLLLEESSKTIDSNSIDSKVETKDRLLAMLESHKAYLTAKRYSLLHEIFNGNYKSGKLISPASVRKILKEEIDFPQLNKKLT